MQSGTVIVLCGGQKRVVSLASDVAYDEKQITKLRFDRVGEIQYVCVFKKRHYDECLREEIAQQL